MKKFLRKFKLLWETKVNVNKITVLPPKESEMSCHISEPIELDGGREYLMVANYEKKTIELYKKIGILEDK